MDIAIKFDKISLDESLCFFKPVSIVRGSYKEDEDLFFSDYGEVLPYIDGASISDEALFYYPTNIEALKELYGKGVSEEALLTNYFSMCQQNCYIGLYNEDDEINLFELPIYEVYEGYLNMLENEEVGKATVTFDLDYLREIRNYKTIGEIKKALDTVLKIADSSDEDIDEVFSDDKKEKTEQPKKTYKVDKEASKSFNLAKLRKEVLSTIVAQDEAVKKITTAIAVNYTSKNPRHKSHILITGPSGTGKTEMVNIIAKYLGVPCFKADATQYTKEGYVGKSVQSLLIGLLDVAGGDIKKAQNGILVIDEIDKKSGGDRSDVSGEAVLSSLLKMMDRDIIDISTDYYKSIRFDTSNLTIIFMGAFSNVYKKKGKNKKISIGFSNQVETSDSKTPIHITKQDLIDDGMTPEFMGRIDEVISTEEFTLENLVEILYKSKNSPIKREREYFNDMDIKTTFTKDFYTEVAKFCINSGTGARELKRCVHESLVNAYDEVLMGKTKIKQLKFTGETVKDPKKYYVS